MFVKKMLKMVQDESKKKLESLQNAKSKVIQSDSMQLPPNFSEQVFNLELEAESPEVDIYVINRLLELYAQAIEYYENIKSDKYQIFKNKTRQLLLKQNVNEAMEKAHEILKTDPNEELNCNIKIEKFDVCFDDEAQMRQRQKELELNMKYIQQQDTKESAQTMLHSHSQELRVNKTIIQKDSEQQKSEIEKRLQMRKKKKQGLVDTEESENDQVQSKIKKRNSQEILRNRQSLLDMDIQDVTSPSKTEPSCANSQNYQPAFLSDEKDYYSGSNTYEKMISQMMSQNQRNQCDVNDENSYQVGGFYGDNNEIEVNQQVVNQFKPQQSSEQFNCQQKKKRKVKISQKSIIEFQLQNSVIPF